MEHKISEIRHKFLSEESRKWAEQGLITSEQRSGILESYTITRSLPVVVLSLGVIMIGVGILSFIAANWQVLPPWCRIVLVIGAYAGSVVAAWAFERRGNRPLADILLLLSGFFLLGGMALMSQIFHIQGSLDGLLGVWLIVYLPTLLLTRNLSIYLFYEIVAIIYINARYFIFYDDFRYYHSETVFDVTTLFLPWQPLVLMILLLAVAWWMWREDRINTGRDDASLLKRLFVGGATRRIFFANFLIMNWFTWICVLNSTGRTVLPYVFGFLAIGALILAAARKMDAPDLEWQGVLCVTIAGYALTFPWTWHVGSYYRYEASLVPPLIASVCLGAYLIARILRRSRGGGFATFLFCVLLMRWYFDMFYSFMSKSLFFILGGLILLAIAYVYRRWRKEGKHIASTDLPGGTPS